MKKLWNMALMLICISGYTQDGELPREVQTAFQAKYGDVRIGDWWLENQLYYIDFNFQGGSYIAVFEMQGTWKETAEIISEMYLPEALKAYIRKNLPTATICYCEEVETPGMKKFLRINLIDAGHVDRVIKSDQDGKNIEILDTGT
jgi:hypothetical protein